jgi:hypothetical protein
MIFAGSIVYRLKNFHSVKGCSHHSPDPYSKMLSAAVSENYDMAGKTSEYKCERGPCEYDVQTDDT